jgi:hypothetical protein
LLQRDARLVSVRAAESSGFEWTWSRLSPSMSTWSEDHQGLWHRWMDEENRFFAADHTRPDQADRATKLGHGCSNVTQAHSRGAELGRSCQCRSNSAKAPMTESLRFANGESSPVKVRFSWRNPIRTPVMVSFWTRDRRSGGAEQDPSFLSAPREHWAPFCNAVHHDDHL